MRVNTPLVLLILDGWGLDKAGCHNAITTAQTPNWDTWWQTMPHGALEASGEAVGLPAGQMGNSEVGHMHIGAGRLIPLELTRIYQAIQSGAFSADPHLLSLCAPQQPGEYLHVMGLLSNGGVHSHEAHLFAFLRLCQQQGVERIALHLFLDGRDTAPQSALESVKRLEAEIAAYPNIKIASLCGRYYAMDRDHRWDRIEKAYALLTAAEGARFPDATTALTASYENGVFDEFVLPTVIGEPLPLRAGDRLFCFNFRADRMRQLMNALVSPDFSAFARAAWVPLKQVVTMTQYAEALPVEVVFLPVSLTQTLGEVLASHQYRQLRIAETEKYAHVTYFLNGGKEAPLPGETRELIPSPQVATYDLQPVMSAEAVTHALVSHILSGEYDVLICNYANADMVGHTGVMGAAVEAVACLDQCMGRVAAAVAERGGVMMITADHGNAEVMFDDDNQQPHTAHTTQPVPFVFIGEGWQYRSEVRGSLADIAPTVLAVLGLPKPAEMTGQSLLIRK